MLWYKSWLETRWRFFIGLALLTLSATGALFTLSLPVSRNRLIGVRVATGIAELLAMALVSSLVLPVLSPAVGQSYSVGDALIHGACLFIAGTVLFSLAMLLSTVFNDVWRPPPFVLCGATGARRSRRSRRRSPARSRALSGPLRARWRPRRAEIRRVGMTCSFIDRSGGTVARWRILVVVKGVSFG